MVKCLQGTLIGQLEYIVQSNDNADIVSPEDRFKYIDDLSVLHLVCLSGLLVEYDFEQHVASDVGVDQLYLPAMRYGAQDIVNFIYNWTTENKMKLNASKCNFMIFSRIKSDFTTRLTINNTTLERLEVTKILGVWISADLSWSRNCVEICKRAFSRLSMVTKLKYAGVSLQDLLDIYILFIRIVTEYCAVVFHSSLTVEQSRKLEMIQKTCLKVILGENYVSYDAALEMCGLKTLSERRQDRCLNFATKSTKHPRNNRLFPLKPKDDKGLRTTEQYKVNFASGGK